ncbi:MAG: L-glutamate gamma-semialdehyde dehydrogenase [Methanobacteriota archaeon]|nr:MAG: L-glutamate gamma-semialdehyde dehydrogenase [Euryarchaeota archaeon]
MTFDSVPKIPKPSNEPILGYMPGSPELKALRAEIDRLKNMTIDVPLVIGGEKIFTEEKGTMVMPHNHQHVLGHYSKASKEHLLRAIEAAKEAKEEWESYEWYERAAVFLKAADLLSGRWRATLNAATMLGQSKNIFQAEIDSACELIDFLRFNAYYMQQIYEDQPYSPKGMWNTMDYRPLEGFVFAVTPFNFTSIAGNLPTSPAMMGNTVLWKPASSAVYSAHFIMELLEEAGLPKGVINFIPGRGADVGKVVLPHPDLAGIHFTGSTETFRQMWRIVGENIATYKSYPRIVGETGGKDFIFVHESANPVEVAVAALRASFEYCGQKCSASSRMYVPKSLWPEIKRIMLEQLKEFKMGDPEDVETMMNAVIDQAAYEKITQYISYAEESSEATIITEGTPDSSVGYFIPPTIIETTNPKFKTMEEEIFGPVLTVYPYDNDKFDETLKLCDQTSIYALTGSIFAKDRAVIKKMTKALRHAAGNFYINDKPTAAVVGQQPFGGGRASGTNDKAGSYLNLIRWTSVRSIKETFDPPKSFWYPYMRAGKE